MRLNKYLSECGVCSRREADRLIEEGKVYVNGVQAEVGMQAGPGDKVTVLGKPIEKAREIMVAFYKPRGIVSSSKHNDGAKTAVECVDVGTRVYPVGRLDKDSEGLLLLTNMGDLAEKIAKAGDTHEKEYVVTVKHTISGSFIDRMRRGVTIELPVENARCRDYGRNRPDGRTHTGSTQDRTAAQEPETYMYTTKPCRVERIDDKNFRIILTEGKNRQIRRMCEVLGQKVVNLKRVRVMNIELGDLKPGQWRIVKEKIL